MTTLLVESLETTLKQIAFNESDLIRWTYGILKPLKKLEIPIPMKKDTVEKYLVPIWLTLVNGKYRYKRMTKNDPLRLELRRIRESEKNTMILDKVMKDPKEIERGVVPVYWNEDKQRIEGYFEKRKRKFHTARFYKRWKGEDVWAF